MSCPHSSAIHATPVSCSMCLGIKPKIVKIVNKRLVTIVDGVVFDVANSVMTVDGANTDRAPEPPPDSKCRGRVYMKRTRSRCSVCGKFDHTRASCGK